MKFLSNSFSTCKQVAALIDKRSFGSISLRERLHVSLHKWNCKCCQGYQKQSELLDKFSSVVVNKQNKKRVLPDNVKLRIIESLREK